MTDAPAAPPDDPLKMSAQFVKGVGPGRFELLKRLGVETVEDLLFFFPRDYEDLSDLRSIANLTSGKVQTVVGEVVEIEGRTVSGGRDLVSIVLSDGSNVLEGVWFNQPYVAQRFRYGQRVSFSGKPKKRYGHWQMSNPRVLVLGDEEAPGVRLPASGREGLTPPAGRLKPEAEPARAANVLPIYPLTEGLRAEQMRRIVRGVVQAHAGRVVAVVPEELSRKHRAPAKPQAVRDVHVPESMPAANRAKKALIYEEFLLLQVALAMRRRDVRERGKAAPLPLGKTIDAHIRRLFPFDLTKDQNRVVLEIGKDMGVERPMQRLLQADVGAGKTAVAVYALLVTVAHKHQAVLMAPTEVLARQHWRTLGNYLAHSRVRRELLTGGLNSKQRKTILGEIRMGRVDLVVGTTAIIQKDVEFQKLGLVVIDEQHRFGVAQRAHVKKLGGQLGGALEPHYLVMTATPIPRTMALTVFGDLDVSVIRELPPGRKPVATRWLTEDKRPKLEEHLRKRLREGRQLYVVCPLVDEGAMDSEGEAEREGEAPAEPSEEVDRLAEYASFPPTEKTVKRDIKAAEQMFDHLREGPFKDFDVGLLHGRMQERTKDQVMTRFRNRELQVLVSTSVIEVGVDVPNATLMVIEHGDRFGLSQLHQLRGRVSRGHVAGECYLFAEEPTEESRARLRLFVQEIDGFALAEEDAKLRGFGEFFGLKQHGRGEFNLGNPLRDLDILSQAREDAFALVAADPGLRKPQHANLRRAVLDKYGRTLDLAEIG